MPSVTSIDWQEQIQAGRKYLQTAQKGLNRPGVFNNELIYHLTAMAIEKLLVGVFQYHHEMPVDHTLGGLVDDLQHLCPLEKALAENIKALGRFDDMCPLIPVDRKLPNDLEIKAMLAVGRQVVAYAEQQVQPSVKAQSG